MPNVAVIFILLFSSLAYAAAPMLFMGAFFPAWLAAMIIALPMTLLLVAALARLNLVRYLQPRGLIYLAFYAITCALVWLVALT
ncbi:YtcA family lipoprotein [uncultured Deefgea sp.]|uniref:YtcA family lipoprotein n=1 Tax=uncultured Deefgea sp. TaxID=1304914 RepID=UPI002616AFB7|nr:YtcA family lipoprotein [uncultured Deefgea sp.]